MTINLWWFIAPLVWLAETSWELAKAGWNHPVRAAVCAVLAGMVAVLGARLTFDITVTALFVVTVWWAVPAAVGAVLEGAARLALRWPWLAIAFAWLLPVKPWSVRTIAVVAGLLARMRLSWAKYIGRWWRPAWRRWWVYERTWPAAMGEAGLSIPVKNRRDPVPPIVKVTCGPFGDVVIAHALIGQTLEQWEKAAEALGYAFLGKPNACRVAEDEPGRVRLELATADALAETIPALPISEDVDLESVPVGRTANGDEWRIRLFGTHWLLAGTTGAGKGSVLQSIVRGLAPAIRDGTVVVWGFDPKGGMEFRWLEPMCDRYIDDDRKAMSNMLGDAVKVLDQRTRRLAGVTRLHVPTVDEPMILILIDELADLTGPMPDSKLQKDIRASLERLLNKGRAAGVVVFAAVQNPLVENVPMRHAFPDRITLRLKSRTQIDPMLGEGAVAMGARCDRIGVSMPGCGYVWPEDQREPTKVRAAYVRDEDIQAMVAAYSPHVTST